MIKNQVVSMSFDSFAKARTYPLSNYPTMEEHPMWLVHIYFLPSVVGKVKCTSQKMCKVISRNVTVSDEAFALLCVANIYDRVIYQCFVQEPDILNWSDRLPNPLAAVKNKYTEKSQDFSAVKFQGWSLEGLKVFNRLCQDIEEFRQTTNSVQSESAILAHELQLSANSKGRGSVTKELRELQERK